MMITMIVIALALGAMAVLYGAVRRRHQSSLPLRPVDVQALRTLMDRDDELFLREKLPHSRFRRLKRQRILVTMSYVSRISSNSSVVMRLGEAARLNSDDPQVAQAAGQVIELATQIRLQCMVAFAKLAAEFAVPSLQLTPAMLVPRYQTLRENVLRLGALELQGAAPVAVAI